MIKLIKLKTTDGDHIWINLHAVDAICEDRKQNYMILLRSRVVYTVSETDAGYLMSQIHE